MPQGKVTATGDPHSVGACLRGAASARGCFCQSIRSCQAGHGHHLLLIACRPPVLHAAAVVFFCPLTCTKLGPFCGNAECFNVCLGHQGFEEMHLQTPPHPSKCQVDQAVPTKMCKQRPSRGPQEVQRQQLSAPNTKTKTLNAKGSDSFKARCLSANVQLSLAGAQTRTASHTEVPRLLTPDWITCSHLGTL